MKLKLKETLDHIEEADGVLQFFVGENEWDKNYIKNLKSFLTEQRKFKQDRYDYNKETNIKNAKEVRNRENSSEEEKDMESYNKSSVQEFDSRDADLGKEHENTKTIYENKEIPLEEGKKVSPENDTPEEKSYIKHKKKMIDKHDDNDVDENGEPEKIEESQETRIERSPINILNAIL